MSRSKEAVLLLAHGSPESAADIPEFMRLVTGGRQLAQAVIDEVQHRYSLIGRSPLLEITLRQAGLLEQKLEVPVYVGMRNWKPFIAEAVQKMAGDGVTHAAAICLAPQNSRTSVGLYGKALNSAAASHRIAFEFVESWHDHPQLIRAFAERLKTAWTEASATLGQRVPVIFTAHSVPARTVDEGDPYERQARNTAELVRKQVAELKESDVRFAFQSQGMAREAWLGPTAEESILALKAEGHKAVLIQPIGFLCDHVEVLYDIDISFKALADKNGMKLWRTQSLNESPALTGALADLAQAALHGERETAAKAQNRP